MVCAELHVSVHFFKPATIKQPSMHIHMPFGSTAKCQRILALYCLICYHSFVNPSLQNLVVVVTVVKKVKSFPSHMAHRAALISVSIALSQTPACAARPRTRG